jgi:hypothetical protein
VRCGTDLGADERSDNTPIAFGSGARHPTCSTCARSRPRPATPRTSVRVISGCMARGARLFGLMRRIVTVVRGDRVVFTRRAIPPGRW